MIDALPLLLSPEGYQISRSVRLRSSASAYFSRTLSTPSSGTTWTLSGWIKRGTLGVENQIFSAGAAVSDQIFFQNSTDVLIVYLGTNTLVTSQVFRDPSSWYHIVLQVDTTQATTSNRVRLYVNGIQVTAFSSTSYPAQNATTKFNSASAHNIGRYQAGASGYFDGYLTEVNFIDGQALTPSSFGEFDAITGVWKPKKYTGTYGTNGFYLNFSDNSAATAAAIGKDYSGNGNNWTPNNISVTAGVTYDSMLDVPTPWADGGNGRGNYATLNPLSKTANATVSDANLKVTFSGANGYDKAAAATIVMQSKTYWEVTDQTAAIATYGNAVFGIVSVTAALAQSFQSSANMISFRNYDGVFYRTGTTNPAGSGAPFGGGATNDVYMFAYDPATTSLWAGRNGTWFNSGNPASGTGAISTANIGDAVPFIAGYQSGDGPASINFGQRPFSYTPPTGFKALNTQNLPDSLVKKGNQYFDVNLWTGNSSVRNIQNFAGMQPDLVWIKHRSGTNPNVLHDSTRGATAYLQSNATSAEATNANSVTSFNSDGFSLGADVAGAWNLSGNTYVGWQWKKGATPGFDIVTYTGTGANRTIAHALGVAPSFMIVKARSSAGYDWRCYHSALGATKYIDLQTTSAAGTASTVWQDTAPTSSVFSVGTNGSVNANTITFVAYLFAEVPGFSKFGSYTGNGSSDGVFVYTGMMPRFILIKRTDAAGSWYIHDTARGTYNVLTPVLYADLSNAEGNYAAGTGFDVLSNGFKARTTNTEVNASGGTYVYAAFASNPFKNSLAR